MVRDPEIAGPTIVRQGEWRTKIQQVFDPTTRTLSRRLYTVWDAAPASDLDFIWTPDQPASDKPGKINGAGLLIWRLKGKPSYDPAAIVGKYRGDFRNGRIEGRGVYLDNTGLYYEGEWKAGLMQGRGTLKLPAGDEYVGQFRVGKANGVGRLIDVTGETYEGPFADGYRHGRGTTTLPNGHKYTSLWTKGKESETSRLIRLAQVTGGRVPGGADDIRIGITIDKRLPPSSRTEVQGGDLWYSATNAANGLLIRPDNKRLMSMWKGGGEIQLLPNEEAMNSDDFGVLSLVRAQLVPLSLIAEVQNRSAKPVQITGLYIDVDSSAIDLQPSIQISRESAFYERGSPRLNKYYHSYYFVENFGWSAAKNAKLEFAFRKADAPARTPLETEIHNIGTIERSAEVDFEAYLRGAGVDVDVLKRHSEEGFPCNTKTAPSCLREFKATGAFGSLADLLSLDEIRAGNELVVGVPGSLDYVWNDHNGAERKARSPFKLKLRLGALNLSAEIGELGSREVVTKKTQRLRVDESKYRIPVSFRTTIAAGRTARLVLPIEAEKSSVHDFKIVVQFADGKEIDSRPINLLYYRPRWLADYNLAANEPDKLARENYDLEGDDLRRVRAENQWQCQSICDEEAACRAFSEDRWNKVCFLKGASTVMRFDPQYSSGLKEGTPEPGKVNAPKVIERYRNKAFPGFSYLISQQSSFEECEKSCIGDDTCVALTFRKKAQTCYLFGNTELYSEDFDADSAVKRQPAQ